ncbi:DUF5018 domain-containing protein [Mangrovimonas sp. YM274]|uniref:pectate lyase family protein n=1 Tax=Mangrovimonas sp. YM274 TaxID=3070660 RepID=UPI0027DAEB75|nr:DUF5018 domain-containing protein [Mangrovimonas sp. YM274]WMI69642.1 DUF5018 domain-containing protein [Mangrovimonas sp. YM274]
MIKKLLSLLVLLLLATQVSYSQEALIDFNFQETDMPEGIISDGTISTGGPVNNCTECSEGRLVVSTGGYLQGDVSSCGVFLVKMKSSGSTPRTVTVKYQHLGSEDYIIAGDVSVVQSGTGLYELTDLFPALQTPGTTSIRLENAPSGGQVHIHDLYIESSADLFSEADILTFNLPGQVGEEIIDIDANTIGVSVPIGMDLTSVIPEEIEISPSATISPSVGTARDFSVGNNVSYTVTSQDGNTIKEWLVSVSEVVSSEKDITAFTLVENQIGETIIDSEAGTIEVTVPESVDVTNLVPTTLTISPFADITPSADTPRDFSSPVEYTVTAQDNSTKTWTITVFEELPFYSLDVSVTGIGNVTLSPEGGMYEEGTVVALTAEPIWDATFTGWAGDLSGNELEETITMDGSKSVTATFSADVELDFEVPVGFASVDTGAEYQNYDFSFNGPVNGGQGAADTLWVNGPDDFDMLAWHLYYRNRAYKGLSGTNGVSATPEVIVFTEGVYEEGTSDSSAWGNHMLTVQEQGDLTIIGEQNVVLKFGLNIKRSWNVLIRNLTFYDYYDDGINIGEPETHHIWVDHCTVGHPDTRPEDQDHPDGGIDVKGGASYISLSWNILRNSWKTNLIGHSDSNGSEDMGKLKVTLYANHYFNSNSRNPRVRFGEVHVLNNLVEGITLYGIAASNQSQVYAENNFYLNTRWPMYADRTASDFQAIYGVNTDNTFTSKTGNYPATALKQVGNAYDDSELPIITSQINPEMLNPGGRSVKFDELNPEGIFEPASYYEYEAFPADVVEELIPLYAGADVIDFFQTESLGVLDLEEQLFKLYPNPVKDYLVLQHAAAQPEGTIAVYSLTGVKVMSINVKEQSTITYINLATLANGLYVVHYKDAQKQQQFKIVKG